MPEDSTIDTITEFCIRCKQYYNKRTEYFFLCIKCSQELCTKCYNEHKYHEFTKFETINKTHPSLFSLAYSMSLFKPNI